MTQRAVLALILCVLLVAAAQVIMKIRLTAYGQMPLGVELIAYIWKLILDPLVWAAGILTVAGAFAWYYGISSTPLSVAIVFGSLLYPVVGIAGYFLLGETLSATKLVGIGLVMAGVVLTVTAS